MPPQSAHIVAEHAEQSLQKYKVFFSVSKLDARHLKNGMIHPIVMPTATNYINRENKTKFHVFAVLHALQILAKAEKICRTSRYLVWNKIEANNVNVHCRCVCLIESFNSRILRNKYKFMSHRSSNLAMHSSHSGGGHGNGTIWHFVIFAFFPCLSKVANFSFIYAFGTWRSTQTVEKKRAHTQRESALSHSSSPVIWCGTWWRWIRISWTETGSEREREKKRKDGMMVAHSMWRDATPASATGSKCGAFEDFTRKWLTIVHPKWLCTVYTCAGTYEKGSNAHDPHFHTWCMVVYRVYANAWVNGAHEWTLDEQTLLWIPLNGKCFFISGQNGRRFRKPISVSELNIAYNRINNVSLQ